MRRTVLMILSGAFFGLFAWAYIQTRIPNLMHLTLACFFAVMGRLEDLK